MGGMAEPRAWLLWDSCQRGDGMHPGSPLRVWCVTQHGAQGKLLSPAPILLPGLVPNPLPWPQPPHPRARLPINPSRSATRSVICS